MRILSLSVPLLWLALAGAAVPARAADADLILSTVVVTVDMVYAPPSKRSPMKASTIAQDEHGPNSKASLSDIAKATFSVYNLSLTGLLEDPRSKEAMLIDSTTGFFYTLKAGKLLDSKKKQVPGVSGVIKGKQVVLMTEDKKIHQLTLQKKE